MEFSAFDSGLEPNMPMINAAPASNGRPNDADRRGRGNIYPRELEELGN